MTEWYIREYRCRNGITMKTKFPVRTDGKNYTRQYRREIRRGERKATQAKHEAARLINNNFRADRDVYLGLDYSDKGIRKLETRAGTDGRDEIYFSAGQEIVNFIRRVKRACQKAGIEFKYVFVTSDRDGKTMDPVRVHHHMIVNKEAAEICQQKWTAGGTWSKTLWSAHAGDLTDISDYMVGQVRHIKDAKSYTPSRNLERAEARPPVKSRNPNAELRCPAGCMQLYRSEYYYGRPQYLRYFRPPNAADDDEE